MSGARGEQKQRLAPITVLAAAVFAVIAVALMLLVSAAPTGALGGVSRSGDPSIAGHSYVVLPAVANPNLYVNRSQSAGTYVKEYASLNNSTALTALPFGGATTHGCRWVTILNATQASSPASAFHNVQYANVTTANGSGTVRAGINTLAFDACSGTPTWVNYVYWTYSIYQFSSVGLGANTTIKVGSFSFWPGTTTGPAGVQGIIGPSSLARFLISSNLTTFTVTFATQVNGSTTCDVTGQICSYSQWTYSSSADAVNVTTAKTLVFSAASGFRVNAAYENWTISFTAASVSVNTALGGFFASASSGFTTWFLNLWFIWVLIILILIAVGAIVSRGRRRR